MWTEKLLFQQGHLTTLCGSFTATANNKSHSQDLIWFEQLNSDNTSHNHYMLRTRRCKPVPRPFNQCNSAFVSNDGLKWLHDCWVKIRTVLKHSHLFLYSCWCCLVYCLSAKMGPCGEFSLKAHVSIIAFCTCKNCDWKIMTA